MDTRVQWKQSNNHSKGRSHNSGEKLYNYRGEAAQLQAAENAENSIEDPLTTA